MGTNQIYRLCRARCCCCGDESEKARKECGRRAPLEQGRNGEMQSHDSFYFTRMTSVTPNALQEWIDDLDAIDNASVLHIFGEHNTAARLLGHAQNQRVPVREAM